MRNKPGIRVLSQHRILPEASCRFATQPNGWATRPVAR